MTVASSNFAHTPAPEPHRNRTKEILRRHPEIRELIGPNPTTFWWASGIVLLQLTIAASLANAPWWLVLGVAYCVGAFANHALFVVVHECAHRLVFRRRLPNRLTGLWANIPLFFPSSVSFQTYHLKHHVFQGVYELDADIPSIWEAKIVGPSALGKALWLLVYPLVQITRPWRLREIAVFDAWTAANSIVQVGFDTAVALLLGPKALIYFLASLFFSIGLHPLGARWIQRHYMTASGEQETFSYYGRLNLLAFNVGYHNEHHDFPSVAWNKLPRIRAIAPEFYDTLSSHTSWSRLLIRFLFDRELSLFSRMVRTERNRVPLTDEARPDIELLERVG
jgi:sphingolipid 4-desaturase/C4-monooxygenase